MNLIKEIEATRPADTPGLETYLTKNYLSIKHLHPNLTNHDYAKKKFLLFLYNEIKKKHLTRSIDIWQHTSTPQASMT